MSDLPSHQPTHPIRDFFQGLGNVAEFLKESTLALIELATGRWPQPFGARRRRPEAPTQGMGPIDRISPFPVDE